MTRNTKIVKKIIALFLVLLLSINSFAAVVSDNDGSAFITKAEFDSLKNNFQSQLDQYNTSIDSKIDNAIASYLSGIKMEIKSVKNFYNGQAQKALVCDTSRIDNLKWGQIGIDCDITTAHMQSAKWNENAGAISWFVMTLYRDGDNIKEFEMFRYDRNTKKLICYTNDLKCTFKCTSIRIENEGWVPITSEPPTWYYRWHAGTHNTATKINTYADYPLQRGKYNTYLASPSWLHVYGRGFNSMIQGNVNGTSGSQGKWVYQPSAVINSETQILNVIEDSENDTQNKLWTNCDNTKSTIDVKTLNSDYDADTSKFAINYDKTGRTLNYLRPDENQVKFKDGYGYLANLNQTLLAEKTSIDFKFSKVGTMPDYDVPTPVVYTAADWYEPYFENDKEYSKNITNASVDDTLLSKYSSYGWTGKLPQGFPIDVFETNTECSFEITFPTEMVLGFKTTPFSIGTLLKDEVGDADIKMYVDDVEKTSSVPVTLSAGVHKVRLVYNGTSSKPIFFKVGRTASDQSTKNRYIITLPKEYTLTKNQ